ncbi:unnamed protein product [Trifolium pratense]|uniref:Uncharacterized protein n=1 Tax=Trifolium pratense TaxID=57577 RepID=A0ACB0LLX0_TRIPR|nr:unnamed protein product [Trifolium pratense]
MAAPPPCNSLPLRRRRDHDSVEDQNEDQKDPQRSKVGDQDFVREELNTDSVPKVEDQSDPFAKLKSSGGVASLTDREIFDMWLAMRGGKTCSSQEVADKMFSNFKESILDKPSTHADSVPKVEDQSDPFAKLKSSGGASQIGKFSICGLRRGEEKHTPTNRKKTKRTSTFNKIFVRSPQIRTSILTIVSVLLIDPKKRSQKNSERRVSRTGIMVMFLNPTLKSGLCMLKFGLLQIIKTFVVVLSLFRNKLLFVLILTLHVVRLYISKYIYNFTPFPLLVRTLLMCVEL